MNNYWTVLVPKRFVFEGLLQGVREIEVEIIPEHQAHTGHYRYANADYLKAMKASIERCTLCNEMYRISISTER